MAAMLVSITSPTGADDDVVLHVVGEVDITSIAPLQEALVGARSKASGRIVVDLTDLAFIDSAGLGVLVAAAERAKADGTLLELRGLSGSTRRLLRVTGLDTAFEPDSTIVPA